MVNAHAKRASSIAIRSIIEDSIRILRQRVSTVGQRIVPKSNIFRLFFESVDFSKVVLSSRRELNFQGSEPPKNDLKSMPKSRSKTSFKMTPQKSIFGSSWRLLGVQVGAKLGQKLPNSQGGRPPRNFLS